MDVLRQIDLLIRLEIREGKVEREGEGDGWRRTNKRLALAPCKFGEMQGGVTWM